jgi:hypothetical protein
MNDIPAFPLHNHGTQTLGMHFTGMTLRDYFAAHATAEDVLRFRKVHNTSYTTAQAKYRYADQMLQERLKNDANTSNS